jgi:hypothetical protein
MSPVRCTFWADWAAEHDDRHVDYVWMIIDKVVYGTHLFEKHGPLMLLAAVLILAGVQLVSSGLIGEMLSRTYFESQGKPIYSIEKVITGKNASATHS